MKSEIFKTGGGDQLTPPEKPFDLEAEVLIREWIREHCGTFGNDSA